jgi:hypothetical protein
VLAGGVHLLLQGLQLTQRLGERLLQPHLHASLCQFVQLSIKLGQTLLQSLLLQLQLGKIRLGSRR